MGWGVDQNETFPAMIEKETGMKTLNAGIASYGTAREMILLSKLDRSKLKYLILQYCQNDCEENVSLFENHQKLPISPRQEFLTLQKMCREAWLYYPGKYALYTLHVWIETSVKPFIRSKIRPLPPPPPVDESPTPEPEGPDVKCARLFFNTLRQIEPLHLDSVKIIFLNTELDDEPMPGFVDYLKKTVHNPSFPKAVQNITFLNTEEFLNRKQHYYILDDHLNAEGHRVVTREILKAIGK